MADKGQRNKRQGKSLKGRWENSSEINWARNKSYKERRNTDYYEDADKCESALVCKAVALILTIITIRVLYFRVLT
jgi:hypothetical protein